MKLSEVLERLNLDENHYRNLSAEVPLIEGGLYNTLGKDLFDLYRKYDIEKSDQRKIEALSFLLQTFVLKKDLEKTEAAPKKAWFSR